MFVSRSEYKVKPLSADKTLILTHLRDKPFNRTNTAICTRFWGINEIVGSRVFERRLSLQEEGGRLPEGVAMDREDDIVFSHSGAVDDNTPPASYRNYPNIEFLPASALGFVGPGSQVFILGGGNLDYCLHKTFASLVRLKFAQGEKLQVLVALPLVYHSGIYQGMNVRSASDFVKAENDYVRSLKGEQARHTISGYCITVNGQTISGIPEGEPTVELHWFTTLNGMLASPFFPEIQTPAVRNLVLEQLKHI